MWRKGERLLTPNGSADVIIVGAGLSGLSAALMLHKHNRSVVVLEAQHRVGGRVWSERKNGLTIDFGAQWISPHQTRIRAMLELFGIQTIPAYKKGKTIYDLLGKRRAGESAAPPLPLVSKLDWFRFQKKLESSNHLLDSEAPWMTPEAKRLDDVTMLEWLGKAMFSSYGKVFAQLLAEEALCSPLSEVSALDFLWGLNSCGGLGRVFTAEDEWIEGGAQQLPIRMAESLGNCVRTGQPVRKIVWHDSEVAVITDDESWTGRKVIMAIPPAFSNRIIFEPGLPCSRDLLCQRAGNGSVIKYIIVYDAPFWRENGYSGSLYGDAGPIKTTLDSSPLDQSKGALAAFSSGADARRMSALDAASRKAELLSCLGKYYGERALQPLYVYEKDWSADPWARGGYGAHFGPGVLTGFGPALVEPIGPIHWAGSETASVWRLYMEGALQSGERAASEVLSDLGLAE